ncbi:hypothetical protein LIER_32255 [Lithospermum erythrorhizon]|uniref:Uncharacterized protein n=1 Tax=Lithospermum erythrorhizon TaxID=34254 RepID=A0AAV3RXC4_LITER
MRLDDLIGNFIICEMKFDSTKMVKKNGVALNASCREGDEEDLKETISLLAKKFNKTMKRFNKKPYSAGDSSNENDKRSYYITHSDEDSDEEEGSDGTNTFVTFTAQIHEELIVPPTVSTTQPDSISDDEEELTKEELIENYQMLFQK